MSCYEWEHGTLKIPAKEYGKLRRALIEKHNTLQDQLYERALRAHAKILAAKKGKRGFNVYEYATGYDALDLDHRIVRLLFANAVSWDNKPKKLQKPKKKDLDKKPVSKGCVLRMPDAAIAFNDKARTVTWDVPENNHAREHAHEHELAKFFFRKLNAIRWTRGSGGKFLGNDEYNRDEGGDYEGGGGSYVTATYGPKTERSRSYARW